MKIIAHRGNLNGPKSKHENSPSYIKDAMDAGFCVEVDIWVVKTVDDSVIWFGHDGPQYKIKPNFFEPKEYDPFDRIYFHCKNIQALLFCSAINNADAFGIGCKFFTHDKDSYTLVSDGSIWTYPDSKNSLSVLSIPVVYDRNSSNWNFNQLSICEGICTDDALYYDALFNHSAI